MALRPCPGGRQGTAAPISCGCKCVGSLVYSRGGERKDTPWGSALFLRPGIISPEGEGGATDMKKIGMIVAVEMKAVLERYGTPQEEKEYPGYRVLV